YMAPGGTIDRRARIWNDDTGCYQVTARLSPNSSAPDITPCVPQPEVPLPCINENSPTRELDHYIRAPSKHPGGVNMLMCDGSVRFFKDSINLITYRALTTRTSGEVVSSDSY